MQHNTQDINIDEVPNCVFVIFQFYSKISLRLRTYTNSVLALYLRN